MNESSLCLEVSPPNNWVYLQPVEVCPVLIEKWGIWSSVTRLQGRLTSTQVTVNSKDSSKSVCFILG